MHLQAGRDSKKKKKNSCYPLSIYGISINVGNGENASDRNRWTVQKYQRTNQKVPTHQNHQNLVMTNTWDLFTSQIDLPLLNFTKVFISNIEKTGT